MKIDAKRVNAAGYFTFEGVLSLLSWEVKLY